jgi:hypothetical protein
MSFVRYVALAVTRPIALMILPVGSWDCSLLDGQQPGNKTRHVHRIHASLRRKHRPLHNCQKVGDLCGYYGVGLSRLYTSHSCQLGQVFGSSYGLCQRRPLGPVEYYRASSTTRLIPLPTQILAAPLSAMNPH